MRIKTCLTLAIAGVLAAGAGFATTLAQMNMKAMAKQATVAVVAKVTGSRTIDTDNGIATITVFEVEKNVWGAAEGRTLEVLTPGGSAQPTKFRVSEVVAGAPKLFMNNKSLLMLAEDSTSGKFIIVGFNQGNLQIVKNAQGIEAVMLPGARALVPLQEAMADIKQAKADTSTDSVR